MPSWLDEAEEVKPGNKGGSWLDEATPVDNEPYYAADTPEVQAMKAAEQKYEETKPGKLESAGLGFIQGGLRDFGDELISRVAPGKYEDNKLRVRSMFNRAQNENPKTYSTAEFAAMMGTAPVTMNPYAAAGIAGAEGAARTLGRADKINPESLKQAGKNAALDATIGGTLTKAMPYASKAVSSASKPFVEYLKNRSATQAVKALGPTQDMMKKLKQKGLVEDVGNFALDNDIVNWTRSSKGMNEKAEKVTQALADETQPIYQRAKDAKLTKDELLAAIKGREAQLMSEEGMVPVAEKLGKFAKQAEKSNVESYNSAAVRRYRQAVSKGINFNTKPNSQLGADEMRKILREQEMGLIEKVSPADRAANEELFKKIRLGNELEKLSERGEARSEVNNLVGLRNSLVSPGVATAVTAMTGSLTTGAVAGAATAIGGEILRRYGNQWNAKALRGVANAASGKTFAPLFQEALKRGGSAVPMLHQKLMQTNPEYQREYEAGSQ